MEILVVYDVETRTRAGRRRLRNIAKICVAHGQRVQKSVFEVSVNEAAFELLRDRLASEMDMRKDSLRIYRLREPRARFSWAMGVQPEFDLHEPLIL